MKKTKTIAALCAATMVLATMAMPVQAKTTSKTETEVITMDDTPATTTKTKSKTKKTTKKTDEYKDFGKDLKVTAHKPEDITKAYLYATMMCAKSLKITLAKDYKMTSETAVYEIWDQVHLTLSGMLGNTNTNAGSERGEQSVTYTDFGDVMSYFTYVYRTGDTKAIPENYEGMYAFFAAGVDSCTADADSITDVANNICKWLITNTDRSSASNRYSFKGVLGKSGIRRTADGKMLLNCEGYDYVFRTMMSMAGYTAYHVSGEAPGGGHHAWNAIKVGDEYRYYDAGWTITPDNMTYKELTKAGYAPKAWYRDETGIADSKSSPTQKEVEALFIDWRY